MKKLLISIFVALALPAAASAHHHSLFARLSGTGTLANASGTMLSGTLGSGTFHAAVTVTAAATTHTGEHGTLSCAPATAAVTLTGTSTVSSTLTGRQCTFTRAGTTTAAGSLFAGRNTTTNMKAFIVAKADGTVRGAVTTGFRRHGDNDQDGH
jgi:hypothetical protein